MKNKLFLMLLLSACLTPVISFGQQQELVISRTLLPARVTPIAPADQMNSSSANTDKPMDASVRIEDIKLPADGSVRRDEHHALHVRKELLVHTSSSGKHDKRQQPANSRKK